MHSSIASVTNSSFSQCCSPRDFCGRLASEPLSFPMTPEQEEKLAILKWSLLANLTTVRQARSKEDRARAIAEHVNSYIAEAGNDGELADAFLTWVERSQP